jgi:hypothetical protein
MWQHQSSPLRKAEPRAVEHMVAPERDMWQHWSSPRKGGKVRSRGTYGSAEAHPSKEARSRATGHVTAPELTSARRRGPRPWDTWWCRSLPLQGGVDTWQHQSSPLRKVEPGAKGHMEAPELTSARR